MSAVAVSDGTSRLASLTAGRFRVSEVDSWLAQMEAEDVERHPRAAVG